jgi:hypothetical protein
MRTEEQTAPTPFSLPSRPLVVVVVGVEILVLAPRFQGILVVPAAVVQEMQQ